MDVNDKHTKYKPSVPISLDKRTWPSKAIKKPPIWCSVDLRDGNQALVEPMDTSRKLRMFKTLVSMGFKEIEIGFPSASDTDLQFCRHLIDNKLIPDDVTVQVLTQAREHLIDKTFEALEGCKSAIYIFITQYRLYSVRLFSNKIKRELRNLHKMVRQWCLRD